MKQITSREELGYKKWYYVIRKRDGFRHLSTKKKVIKWHSYRTSLNFFDDYEIFELDSLEEREKIKHMIELIS